MKHIANPNAKVADAHDFVLSPMSGTCSEITFHNTDFWKGLAVMFSIQSHEYLIGVTIKDNSILARIGYVDRSKKS